MSDSGLFSMTDLRVSSTILVHILPKEVPFASFLRNNMISQRIRLFCLFVPWSAYICLRSIDVHVLFPDSQGRFSLKRQTAQLKIVADMGELLM